MSTPAVNHPKKVKTAWAMYDWANSVYSLVITTAIFPIFYNALTSERNEAGEIVNDVVTFLGPSSSIPNSTATSSRPASSW